LDRLADIRLANSLKNGSKRLRFFCGKKLHAPLHLCWPRFCLYNGASRIPKNNHVCKAGMGHSSQYHSPFQETCFWCIAFFLPDIKHALAPVNALGFPTNGSKAGLKRNACYLVLPMIVFGLKPRLLPATTAPISFAIQ